MMKSVRDCCLLFLRSFKAENYTGYYILINTFRSNVDKMIILKSLVVLITQSYESFYSSVHIYGSKKRMTDIYVHLLHF